MEYTDAPAAAPETSDAQTTENFGKADTAEGKASDGVAVLLSILPGLGHVYKGHRMLGFVFVIGAGIALLLGGLAATATAGFGLLLIPIYWFAVMFHVYSIDDRVGPDKADEHEQY